MHEENRLTVSNARLLGSDELVSIDVEDGRIRAIDHDAGHGETLDVEGRLVLPGFVDSHFHLDKCFTASESLVLDDLRDYIAMEVDRKRRFTPLDVFERSSRILLRLIEFGVSTVRTHVDVDSAAGLRGLEGILKSREAFEGLIDMQIVAFPQLGIIKDPGTEDLLREAATKGVDAIGGHPQLEPTPDASKRHIETVFDIACAHDLDVDMHVDESDDPGSEHVVAVAAETISRGWQGRVTAGHVTALGYYNDYRASEVIRLMSEARLNVVANPTSSLLFRALRHPEPRPRGMTRVRELIDGGVDVVFGQESVKSTYIDTLRNPDPLQTAQIMAHAVQLKSADDQRLLIDMCTTTAARVLGLERYGIAVGSKADMVVLDEPNLTDAIAHITPRRWVIKEGRVVASTERRTHVTRPAGYPGHGA